MADYDPTQISIRLAYTGPPGAGKTASIERFHRTLEAKHRRELISINAPDGSTLLFDYFPFNLQFGAGGTAIKLSVELYALPGAPRLELARRMLSTSIDGFIFTADGRDEHQDETLQGLRRFEDVLRSMGKTLKTAAVIVQLNKRDLFEGTATPRVMTTLQELVGDRIVLASAKTGDGLREAVNRAAALALKLERPAIEARRLNSPPPRVDAPPELDEDFTLAYRLYLRSFHGRPLDAKNALDSPHSEVFFGKVLLELGAVAEAELDEALRVRAQAIDLALGVSLEDVLLKKELVDQDRLMKAHRIRAAAEVIHEELLFGKIASELDVVPFQKVKRALLVQSRRSFMHSLAHLLSRAGALDLDGQQKVFQRLLQVHQGELLREKKEMKKAAAPIAKKIRESRRIRPLFGTIAVQHGFITDAQLEECLREQRELAERGERRFLGNLLQRKGYLGDEEIKVIVKALEDEIANDHVEGYRIISPLGRGAMALVYAARQLNLDRVVALKVLDPKLPFMDADFIDRFMSEAKAAARLNHPNIVQAYDVGTSNGYHFFAMEYVEGVTLRELQDECSGPLEVGHAIFVVREVARALSHAEAHRLVHRDIKPGNVMIARTGVVKLCDLGLAQQIDANDERDKGVIMGSPFYIAPEQIEGRTDLDSRADIYALGATLFHLLTGHPPFTGRSPEDVCLRHLSDPVPDPRAMNPEVTQRIVQVVYRMMSKDREDRYPTVHELIAELNRLLPSERTDDDRQGELAKLLKELFPKRRSLA